MVLVADISAATPDCLLIPSLFGSRSLTRSLFPQLSAARVYHHSMYPSQYIRSIVSVSLVSIVCWSEINFAAIPHQQKVQ